MKRPSERWTRLPRAAALVALALSLAGCPPQGPAGTPGSDGLSCAAGLPNKADFEKTFNLPTICPKCNQANTFATDWSCDCVDAPDEQDCIAWLAWAASVCPKTGDRADPCRVWVVDPKTLECIERPRQVDAGASDCKGGS